MSNDAEFAILKVCNACFEKKGVGGVERRREYISTIFTAILNIYVVYE